MKSQTLSRSASAPGRLGAFHQQRVDETTRWFEAQRSMPTLHNDELAQLSRTLRIPPEQVLTLHAQFGGEVHGLGKALTAEDETETLSDADLAQRFMALSIEACPSHDRWECLQSWLRHAPRQTQEASAAPAKLPMQVLTLAANDSTDFQELVYRGVMPQLDSFSEAVQIRLLLCVAHADPDVRQDAINGLRARGQVELAEQVQAQLSTPPAQWPEQAVDALLAQLEQSSDVGDLAHRSQLLLLCGATLNGPQRDRLLDCVQAALVQNLRVTPPGLKAHAGCWAWMEHLPPQLARDAFKRLPLSQQQRLLLNAPDNPVSAVCHEHTEKSLLGLGLRRQLADTSTAQGMRPLLATLQKQPELLRVNGQLLLALADHGPIAAREDPELFVEIAELCITAARGTSEPEVIWNILSNSADKLTLPVLRTLDEFLQRHLMEMPVAAINGYVHVRNTMQARTLEISTMATHPLQGDE